MSQIEESSNFLKSLVLGLLVISAWMTARFPRQVRPRKTYLVISNYLCP